MLAVNDIRMLTVWYSAFREIKDVIDPAPAINGKAIGTMAPDPSVSCLNSSIPITISIPINKRINEPAIAKEEMSTPKILSNGSPIKRKRSIMPKATRVVRRAYTLPIFDLMSRIIGIDPKISMMAKSTINEATISTKFICMIFTF